MRGAGRRGRGVVALVAVALAVGAIVVAGVTALGDRDDVQTGASGPDLQDESGYPAMQPVIAAQGDVALIVRGAPASTAALYGSDDAALIWEGDLPFPDPVVYPDVVALDGGDFVVTGVPCRTIVAMNDSGPDCAPGGVAVARFRSDDHRFQVLAADGLDQQTPYINVLGETSRGLALQIDASLYTMPVAGGTLSELSSPPLEGLSLACLQDDKVVAVAVSDGPGDSQPAPGEHSSVEAAPFVPFDAAVLELDTGKWTDLGGPDATSDMTDTFELGCVETGVVGVPTETPMTTTAPYVTHVLNTTRADWVEMAPPPREFLAAAPVVSEGDRLVLSVSSDPENSDTALLTFDAQTGVWASEAGVAGSGNSAMALARDHLWSVPSGSQAPQVMALQP